MNIRCSFCQMPYTLSRVEMLDALQEMDAGKLNHYDAHCPRCRRATRVERKRMEMFFPNWRDALKQFEAEMKAHPQQAAPLPKPEPAPLAQTESKPEPLGQRFDELSATPQGKPVPAKEKPAAKKSTAKTASTAKAKAPAKSSAKGKKKK